MKRKTGAGRVSATEAAKNFGRLADRVREEGITYIVERGGTPVVRVSPVDRAAFTLSDFKALVTRLPRADAAFLDAVTRAAGVHNRPRVRRNPWAR